MNKILVPLSKVPVGETCLVISILRSSKIKSRLLDLGFVPNTKIEVIKKGPGGNPRAYSIKNSVIALRDEDAEKIIVKLGEWVHNIYENRLLC